MWQAIQISITGIGAMVFGIFLLYCTVLVSGYVTKKIERRGASNE